MQDRVSQNRHPGRLEFACLLLGLTALSALACAGIGPVPPVDSTRSDETYVIGPTKNPELRISVPVRSDGKISVPLLDDVQAAGLTPEELKEVITQLLSEFVAAPDVTVVVTQMTSRTVTVVAEQGRSAVIPLGRKMRVLDAIAQIGGFGTWARKDRVKILRPTPQGLVEYRFNYGAFVSGKAPDSNFLLEPGDTIVVPD
jgi:polysaccharide export outer membrane protein